jgi:hypothetical protein
MTDENIYVQQYLNQTYINLSKLSKSHYMINNNYKITQQNDIIIIDNILTSKYFHFLRNQFNNKQFKSRNFMIYRKASSINFFDLHKEDYTGLIELYYSNELMKLLTNILKKPVQRVNSADDNACSLLIYTNKGDHINWHVDDSNYYGDRYVALLTLVNENETKDNLSHNIFKYKHKNKIYEVKMKENSLIIFKGSDIPHQSTAIEDNERRILFSMTFCDICQEKKNILSLLYYKCKNFILYG